MNREEALKIVRENYPHFGTTEPWLDLEKALATLIPELRESEDERIRKFLIKLVNDGFTHFPDNITRSGVLAYLEKQKEQKPVDRFEEARKKYQVEWSDEDEKTISDSCCWLAEYAGYLMDKNYGKASMLMGLTEKLKSLSPSWKPSEQEKGALRTAIHILTDERSFPKAAAHLQDILNAFEGKESRKDWKPSEEQMEALKDAVRLFKENHFEKFHYKIESLYEQLKKLT